MKPPVGTRVERTIRAAEDLLHTYTELDRFKPGYIADVDRAKMNGSAQEFKVARYRLETFNGLMLQRELVAKRDLRQS